MAWIALAMVSLFLVMVFPVRARLLLRRFGTTGGVDWARLRPARWIAADTAFLGGFALVVTGPLLQGLGVLEALVDVPLARAVGGVVLGGTGLALAVWAQETMGVAWRPDIAPAEAAEIVTRGPFAIARHPSYVAMLAVALGAVVLAPNACGALGVVVLLVGLVATVRAEEAELLARYGDAYRAYAARVGALGPVGRWPAVTAAALAILALAGLAACGGSDEPTGSARDWPAVLQRARGDTVRFWMYGGDQRVNDYVDEDVAPALAKLGVRLRRVPVGDTADAVSRIVAQRRAGRRSGGGVDLVWINGENFAAGKRARLWLRDWSTTLPNARGLDPGDRTVSTDFQVAVDGQESPWQRAAFVFAYDADRVRSPPRDLDALLAYARAHPGRVTYPAPPDFTGSAFVRQVVAVKGEEAALAYLEALKPLMWRGGDTLPKSQAELDRLFGDGQVDFAMAYDADFVGAGVRKGTFPDSARPFVLRSGTLANVSFVAIPADAAHPDAAKVLANLLLDPAQQARKADPRVLGNPTVLDLGRLDATQRRAFARVPERSRRYVPRDLGRLSAELAAGRVAPLERRWREEILR
ncbi:hypothetical protein BH20ACT17_BH20ACT17_01700 [soil metagenome]